MQCIPSGSPLAGDALCTCLRLPGYRLGEKPSIFPVAPLSPAGCPGEVHPIRGAGGRVAPPRDSESCEKGRDAPQRQRRHAASPPSTKTAAALTFNAHWQHEAPVTGAVSRPPPGGPLGARSALAGHRSGRRAGGLRESRLTAAGTTAAKKRGRRGEGPRGSHFPPLPAPLPLVGVSELCTQPPSAGSCRPLKPCFSARQRGTPPARPPDRQGRWLKSREPYPQQQGTGPHPRWDVLYSFCSLAFRRDAGTVQ